MQAKLQAWINLPRLNRLIAMKGRLNSKAYTIIHTPTNHTFQRKKKGAGTMDSQCENSPLLVSAMNTFR